MWITNGGFADLFIVFAKVDGEHFTAFIVERAFPGVTSGKEEHKMGLHGSSTTPVILQDVRVPAENLLGEVGKGHKIAFNVLNFGRFKLGAMCGGGAQRRDRRGGAVRRRRASSSASRSRRSAPSSTSSARWSSRTYAVESLIYRTAGLIDARIAATPHDAGRSVGRRWPRSRSTRSRRRSPRWPAARCSNFVLDENIQIHGGNGFVRDYPAERHYRDSRVNRIFEGTNEINRLLIPGMLARRAVKGELPLIAAAKALQDELLGPPAHAGRRRRAARRRAARRRRVQEGGADGVRPGACRPTARSWPTSRKC